MMLSVLQPWVMEMPIKMQSTLILGLRGPDTHACPNIKTLTRWLRGLAFVPGDMRNLNEFMGQTPERIKEKGPTAKELEFCTQHFYSHLMHSLEVVGYMHPKEAIRTHAFWLFVDMCQLMHLPVEEKMEFEHRLKNINWPEGKQPVDFEEAVALLAR